MRKYRGLLVIGLLLVLPLLSLYIHARRGAADGLLRSTQWLTGPVQTGIVAVKVGFSSTVARYLWFVGLRRHAELLELENNRLTQELQRLEEEARQNTRLRRLLGLVQQLPQARFVGARVIATGQSQSYRTLRLDRGRRDGVERRAGVLTADGVVGRVVASSWLYADVLLLTDAASRLDVIDARSRARGVLRGGGIGAPCRIEAMDRTLDIAEDDLMLTSGLDGVFPKGVPVGIVRKVRQPNMGLYLDADVEPHVRPASLEEVLVLIEPDDAWQWPELGGVEADGLVRGFRHLAEEAVVPEAGAGTAEAQPEVPHDGPTSALARGQPDVVPVSPRRPSSGTVRHTDEQAAGGAVGGATGAPGPTSRPETNTAPARQGAEGRVVPPTAGSSTRPTASAAQPRALTPAAPTGTGSAEVAKPAARAPAAPPTAPRPRVDGGGVVR